MTESPTVAAALAPVDAVIFELDGVVTDTGELRAAAWKQLVDDVMRDPRLPAGARRGTLTDGDFARCIEGRTPEAAWPRSWPRAASPFPAARPRTARRSGRRSDSRSARTNFSKPCSRASPCPGLPRHRGAARAAPGRPDPGGPRHVRRNAAAIVAAAGLGEVFDHVVDGQAALDHAVAGMPAPALVLEAVRRLDIPPARAMVIAAAAAGVEAGRRGGFGLVVGLDRTGRRAELEAAGADVVVEDVSELDIGLVITHPWLLVYEGFDPAHEGHREALTTLGNGYMATRGAAPEHRAGEIHYPGSYLAGVYNRLASVVQGQRRWTSTWSTSRTGCRWTCGSGDGAWWSDGGLTLRSERRTLDLKRALLTREALLEDDAGRQLQVVQRRLVSMAEPHLAALETTLTAVGWSGTISVRSGCDTDVTNSNVPEDAQLANRHLTAVEVSSLPEGGPDAAELTVQVQTSQSRIGIALALRTRISGGGEVRVGIRRDSGAFPSRHGGTARPPLRAAGHGRHPGHGDQDGGRRHLPGPRHRLAGLGGARGAGARTQDFDALLADHETAWSLLLAPFIIESDAPSQAQLILNLHVFHLLQTLTTHTAELDAGVPARGLHGEGYRGHVFWDELFVLPVLNSRLPAVARELIDYRWRRLGTARDAARRPGCGGALFPWQSGSDGTEQTPKFLFNKLSGHWMPDHSHLQRHVGLAVAYNAWQYFEATQDRGWLTRHGAEILVDVARLFASMAEHDAAEDRFHIRGVMGPDEYHTGHPGNPGGGLDDNAYTNIMAAWVFDQAVWIMHSVQGFDMEELRARLRHHGHGNRRLGAPEPAHVRALPRRRHHQPVRRLRRAPGTRLEPLPPRLPQHRTAGPDPGSRRGQHQPLPAGQTGGRPDAPVCPGRGPAPGVPAPDGLRRRAGADRGDRGLLPGPDRARLHPQPGHPRLGAGAAGSGAGVGHVPGSPGRGPGRYPGRHHERGHPSGCHGRLDRRGPAQLRRAADHPGRPRLHPAAAGRTAPGRVPGPLP